MIATSSKDDSPFPIDRFPNAAAEKNIWRISPIALDLIDAPLDFIFAEHYRQREAAAILCLIADGNLDRCGVRQLIDFFERDFVTHIADEEIVLFPILAKRAQLDDRIDIVLAKLREEHKEDETTGDAIIKILQGLLAGRSLTNEDKSIIRLFADHIRSHLALENCVLLPLARARLDAGDLDIISGLLRERHEAHPDRRR